MEKTDISYQVINSNWDVIDGYFSTLDRAKKSAKKHQENNIAKAEDYENVDPIYILKIESNVIEEIEGRNALREAKQNEITKTYYTVHRDEELLGMFRVKENAERAFPEDKITSFSTYANLNTLCKDN